MPKRGRSRSRVRANYARVPSVSLMARARGARASYKKRKSLSSQVARLSRTIETKEGTRRLYGINLQHNNLTVFTMNPFQCTQGTGDPMSQGTMERVGDKITVKSLSYKIFIEASLGRSKVYFRFMLIRMAKGDTLDRSTLFQDSCANKMIDTINRERFTVIASKTVNVIAPNLVASTFNVATGVPTAGTPAGLAGTRIVSFRVPGKKFGKQGVITYENASTSQVKFYDYKLCCVAYDWNGTPQDLNNVGYINDGYVKTYYQDA